MAQWYKHLNSNWKVLGSISSWITKDFLSPPPKLTLGMETLPHIYCGWEYNFTHIILLELISSVTMLPGISM